MSEEEFISIIKMLCSEEANDLVPELFAQLDQVDPLRSQTETAKNKKAEGITFTQMVSLLANYPENNPVLNRLLGEKELLPHEDEEL